MSSTNTAQQLTINEIIPKRFGLSYNPPQIVVEYQRVSSKKLYHHKIRFPKNSWNSKISEVIEDIYKKHNSYWNHKPVNKTEIIQLVQKLREKSLIIQQEENEAKKPKTTFEESNTIDGDEDLNLWSKEEWDLKKKIMDTFYEKHNIKVGDSNFQYDIRKDFTTDQYNAEWDDDE